MRPPHDQQGYPPRRLLPQIGWRYSAILGVAVVLWIITLLVSRGDDAAFVGTVKDAYTGEPVEAAAVAVSGTAVETNGSGKFEFDDPVTGSLSVARDGYQPTQVSITPEQETLDVTLRPTTLSGTVINERSDDPMPGVTVSVMGADGTEQTTTTDEDGKYLLTDVPPDATVKISLNGYSEVSQPVGQNKVLDFTIRPDVVTGIVTDTDGNPVPSAIVQVDGSVTQAGPDGVFALPDAPETGTIVVKRNGYRTVVGEIPSDMTFDAQLEPFEVKAIYMTGLTIANDARWNELLDLIESTEYNAVVMDVKDNTGLVRYDTKVPLANEIGANDSTYDLASRIKDLKDRGIYAIARLVVFEDPVLASAKPDLAIKDKNTGGSWTTWDGLAWVNAMNPTVWQYNIDIAMEIANAGFDEIQLDYIRFPTDGPLDSADYGVEFTEESRTTAINDFLHQMRATVGPTGVLIAGDIFGISLWDEGDAGIGQDLEEVAPYLDVICPMVYPSHFAPGTFGFDYPNDHPYDVITWVMGHGIERMGGDASKMRPWLQAFSLGPGIEYGPNEIQAQIQASQDLGSSGWLLWNAANVYTIGSQ